MKLRVIWNILWTATIAWLNDSAPRWGAAIAYYAIFSIAPVLIIAIWIAGSIFGEQAAKGELFQQLNRFLDNEAAATTIQDLVRNAARPRSGSLATWLSIAAMCFGASGVFTQLKAALNVIWGVEHRPERAILAMFMQYAWAIVMVLAAGVLLLCLLVISSVISVAATYPWAQLPIRDTLLHVLDWSVSITVITVLFAAIFKWLPDVHVRWRDVWIGAFITSILFTIGKFLIGWYLAHSAWASTYGAAGSLILVLLWTYYSAQIVLYGAEITHAFARQVGSPIVPSRNARFIIDGERARAAQTTK